MNDFSKAISLKSSKSPRSIATVTQVRKRVGVVTLICRTPIRSGRQVPRFDERRL
jgi:hypothetical protein